MATKYFFKRHVFFIYLIHFVGPAVFLLSSFQLTRIMLCLLPENRFLSVKFSVFEEEGASEMYMESVSCWLQLVFSCCVFCRVSSKLQHSLCPHFLLQRPLPCSRFWRGPKKVKLCTAKILFSSVFISRKKKRRGEKRKRFWRGPL